MNDKTPKWVVVGLFVFIYIPFLYQHGYHKAFIGNGDFPSLYWGAKIAFQEQRSPYVNGVFTEAESQLKQRVFPYLYPPPSLLAFYPFSRLSYEAAKLSLLIISHACFAGFIYLFFFKITSLDSAPPFRGLIAVLSVVYLLAYYPVVDNFIWGQINLIVLVMVCLAWYALKKNRHALAVALPLSLAILLKTYPVLLLPLLFFRKRYRAVVWTLALIGLYTAVAWSVLPREVWGDWVTNVMPTGGYGQRPFNLFLPVAPWNHSINGFGTFLLSRYTRILWMRGDIAAKGLSYLLSASVMAVTLGLSYLSSRKGTAGKVFDIEVSLFLSMMFLVAPLSWEHHLVYVLPSALLSIYLLLSEVARRSVKILVVAALCVVAWDFPRDNMYFLTGIAAFANGIKFYAVFVIWLFFAAKLWERLREDSAPAPVAAGA